MKVVFLFQTNKQFKKIVANAYKNLRNGFDYGMIK
ncbi:hypothetical protein LMOSLCC2376_1394 [Listeria monocytogenes SLCC2376]|nr:hypothetical protein LMOSLCC2376_1394 [Listeria monocytogenes SLCC2376]